MLGRAVHQHAAVLLGNGGRDLAFQIEVVLSANAQRTAESVPGLRERLLGTPTLQTVGRQHEA